MQYFIKFQGYNHKCNWHKQAWEHTQVIPNKQTIQLVREVHKLTKKYTSSSSTVDISQYILQQVTSHQLVC